MPVPAPIPATRRLQHLLRLALCPLLCATTLFARGPEPRLRIPLEPLGYQAFTRQVLASGAAVLTLNYVDPHHLLVTFSVRRLLPRIPDDPPDDLDRNIDAILLELPSGNILARTAWRLHDGSQYLWPLNDGRFLLRIRNRVTTIAPLQNLASGNAFREQPLVTTDRTIGAMLLSPDARVLTIETLDHPPTPPQRTPSPGTTAYAAAMAATAQKSDQPVEERPVQINFYRLVPRETSGDIFAQSAGALRSRRLVHIPADGAGFLSVIDQGRQHWAFNFNRYAGKVDELSPFDSTCHPMPVLVSRAEFVAFGCRSGDQPQLLGGFNFLGEEMWEQILPDSYVNPAFSFAPAAGRFALSRVLATSPLSAENFVADQLTTQSVTVFQTESGRQIFHVDSPPILRATQNFALSPDGSELAVIREGAIELFGLPPLSSKDRAALARAESSAPPLADGTISISAPLSTSNARENARNAPHPATPAPGDPVVAQPSVIANSTILAPAPAEPTAPEPTTLPSASVTSSSSDPEAGQSRKPPTLYAPGEQPEAKPAQKPPK